MSFFRTCKGQNQRWSGKKVKARVKKRQRWNLRGVKNVRKGCELQVCELHMCLSHTQTSPDKEIVLMGVTRNRQELGAAEINQRERGSKGIRSS